MGGEEAIHPSHCGLGCAELVHVLRPLLVELLLVGRPLPLLGRLAHVLIPRVVEMVPQAWVGEDLVRNLQLLELGGLASWRRRRSSW